MAEPTETETPPAPPAQKPAGRPVVWGLLSGWVLIFLPYLVVTIIRNQGIGFLLEGPWSGLYYNASVLLLLPFVQGFVAGCVRGPLKPGGQRGWSISFLVLLWDTLGAAVFLHEGIICLIMASPLLLGFFAIAFLIGRSVAGWRSGKRVSVSLVPLVVLAVIAETAGPKPDYPDAITDSVTVNAPADYVWRYVVQYPDNPNPPDYWLWQLGVPAPTHSVAPVQAVGKKRECRFNGGQVFEERIAELEPNRKLVFVITKQPEDPEIIGHLTVDKGEILLTQNPDGTTTLTATSWYRLHVRPAAYFDMWAADITRHVHFRVLGYMKHLAERDYAAAKSRKMSVPT